MSQGYEIIRRTRLLKVRISKITEIFTYGVDEHHCASVRSLNPHTGVIVSFSHLGS